MIEWLKKSIIYHLTEDLSVDVTDYESFPYVNDFWF